MRKSMHFEMTYTILPYTRQRAERLGLQVRASKQAHKKVDVLRGDKVIARIGDDRYKDFPYYRQLEKKGDVPRGTADKRREAYHTRHGKYPEKRDGEYTPGFLAGQLLW